LRGLRLLLMCCAPAALLAGGAAVAQADSGLGSSGGAVFMPGPPPVGTPAQPTVPGFRAKIVNGLAYAPAEAPAQVQRAIWAGNAIRRKPYVYGGGHGAWISSGYDCSGSVSYVLHAAGLIKTSMDSGQMMSWGAAGIGAWMTVYANPGHAFIQIAGIRLDTSSEGDRHPTRGSGPRWRTVMRGAPGYKARHPVGF
jgi:hypothetical protein